MTNYAPCRARAKVSGAVRESGVGGRADLAVAGVGLRLGDFDMSARLVKSVLDGVSRLQQVLDFPGLGLGRRQ